MLYKLHVNIRVLIAKSSRKYSTQMLDSCQIYVKTSSSFVIKDVKAKFR